MRKQTAGAESTEAVLVLNETALGYTFSITIPVGINVRANQNEATTVFLGFLQSRVKD